MQVCYYFSVYSTVMYFGDSPYLFSIGSLSNKQNMNTTMPVIKEIRPEIQKIGLAMMLMISFGLGFTTFSAS